MVTLLLMLGVLCVSLAITGMLVAEVGLYALMVPSYRLWRAFVLRGPFRRAARRLALSHQPRGMLREGVLRGQRDGFEVQVAATTLGASLSAEDMMGRTRFEVDARGCIPRTLRIGPRARDESGWVEVRDPEFDGRMCAHGPTEEVLARLSAPVRLRLISLSPELRIRDGVLVYETSQLLRNDRAIEHLLGDMTSLVQLLSLEASALPERLLENALHDPLAQVRYRNLEVLLQLYPGTHAAERAIDVYLSSSDPEGGLLAALHAGSRGLPKVKAAARSPQHVLRIRALKHLARRLLGEEARPYFEAALLEGPEIVRAAAVQEIRSLGWSELAPVLRATLSEAGAPSTVAIAEALFSLDPKGVAGVLVEMLHHDSDEVVITAARLLESAGRAVDIAPLRIAADRARRANVSRALRRALSAVLARCPMPERGRLSLSESAGTGHLAMTEPGALSEPGGEP